MARKWMHINSDGEWEEWLYGTYPNARTINSPYVAKFLNQYVSWLKYLSAIAGNELYSMGRTSPGRPAAFEFLTVDDIIHFGTPRQRVVEETFKWIWGWNQLYTYPAALQAANRAGGEPNYCGWWLYLTAGGSSNSISIARTWQDSPTPAAQQFRSVAANEEGRPFRNGTVIHPLYRGGYEQQLLRHLKFAREFLDDCHAFAAYIWDDHFRGGSLSAITLWGTKRRWYNEDPETWAEAEGGYSPSIVSHGEDQTDVRLGVGLQERYSYNFSTPALGLIGPCSFYDENSIDKTIFTLTVPCKLLFAAAKEWQLYTNPRYSRPENTTAYAGMSPYNVPSMPGMEQIELIEFPVGEDITHSLIEHVPPQAVHPSLLGIPAVGNFGTTYEITEYLLNVLQVPFDIPPNAYLPPSKDRIPYEQAQEPTP